MEIVVIVILGLIFLILIILCCLSFESNDSIDRFEGEMIDENERYVLTINRALDSRKKYIDELKKNNFKVWIGLDGLEIDKWKGEYMDKKQIDDTSLKKLTRCQIAITLSHLKIIERAVEENHEYVMICEDDAIIPNMDQIEELIDNAPADYHIISFFHHPNQLKAIKSFTRINDDFSLIPKGFNLWGAVGYVISYDGAKYLLEHQKCYPLREPIDNLFHEINDSGKQYISNKQQVYIENYGSNHTTLQE